MRWNEIAGSTLAIGQVLAANDYVVSPSKTCFTVLQRDGNLCVYAGTGPHANRGFVWSSQEASLPEGDYHAVLEPAGTLEERHGTAAHPGTMVWSAGAAGSASSYHVALDDHGVLAICAGTPDAPGERAWGNFGVTPGSRIEHVVVLMLENRGFDSALGYLYTPEHPPAFNVPPRMAGEAKFFGLAFQPGKSQTANMNGTIVTRAPSCGVAASNSPGFDPGEEYAHVTAQLFGDGRVTPGTIPPMTGFLQDFWNVVDAESHPFTDKAQVASSLTNMFGPWDLPDLSRLAKTYGVSDAWFSSVPTQTNANRAFSLCGQSMGEVDNGYVGGPWSSYGADAFVGANTIFNALSAAGMTDWAIYYNELYPPPPSSSSGSCYTELAFPMIDQANHPGDRFRTIEQFMTQARSGTLPRFSYLEPKWSGAIVDEVIKIDGNDYHPPSDVTHAEQMMRQLYQALTANRAAWQRTLFVIMFDEHGGTYDHVAPKWGATPPWGTSSPPKTQYGFGFDRFGVRVPNLFLSPYIEASTVLRQTGPIPFDHTSMLASVLDWCGIDRTKANLGARTIKAPTFWNVLNRPTPRTDDNAFPVIRAPLQRTPVSFGQRFYLRHASGVTVSRQTSYATYWYPRVGNVATDYIAYEARAATLDGESPVAPLAAGRAYQLRSSEYANAPVASGAELYNTLSSDHEKSVYLAQTDVTEELDWTAWTIRASTPTLLYAMPVQIESVKWPGWFLTIVPGSSFLFIAQDPEASWMLMSAPSGG